MLHLLQSFKTGELWLAEVPAPACKEGGALIRTQSSFVSAGTERMLVDFAQKSLIGKALAMPDQVKKVIRKIKTEGLSSTFEKVKSKLEQPIPLGYSCAGIVEEAGRNLPGIAKGDRVACGGAGFANHAEYNYVPKNLIVKIPDPVSFEDASAATVGAIALQGIRQCEVQLGENVCVLGLGLLGLLAVQMLKAGGNRVVGFDPNPERCRLALDLGADIAINDNLVAAAEAFSQGRGMDAVLIMAATHSNEPVALAGDICRPKGKVVATGMVGMEIPREQYYKKELDFRLSLSYGPGRYDQTYEEKGIDYPYGHVRWTEQRNIAAVLDLMALGKVTPSKLITHRFKFEDALSAYDLLLGKTEEPYLGIVLNYAEEEKKKNGREKIIFLNEKMPVQAISVGFIGTGQFAKGVLLPILAKRNGVSLRGVCATSGMNASETAKRFGFGFAATESTRILSDPDINTVFCATRHNTHAALVTQSLEAGKNVFVEKPLAIRPEELEGVEKACRSSSRILTVGFNRRFSPHAKLISDYFRRRHSAVVLNYRINAGKIPAGHWILDSDIGGGRIVGEGCHFIDFASFVIGEVPVEIQAMAGNSDEDISINIRYDRGSVANIMYHSVGPSDFQKERCEIFADSSVAILEDFVSTRCSGKLGRRTLTGKQTKGFKEEIDAFFSAIKAGGPPPIPYESLFQTTRLTFAALDALKSRSTVVLDGRY